MIMILMITIIMMMMMMTVMIIIIIVMKNFVNKFSYKLKLTKYDLLVIRVIIIIIIIIIKNLFTIFEDNFSNNNHFLKRYSIKKKILLSSKMFL